MRTSIARSLLSLCLAVGVVASAMAEDAFKIGAPAPALKVSKWVKGGPIDELKKGQVYVLEFWATWCGPCRVSIPHLTEMAKKLKGKVAFIGVSAFENDQAKVEPFVKEMGDSMDYNVAMDDQASPTARAGFMSKNWMDAAGQNGIPTAFVVDKDGSVVWVGHPSRLDDVLDQVLAGKWDVQAFAKEFEASQAAQKREDEARANHPVLLEINKIGNLIKQNAYPDALKEIDVLAKMDGTGAPVDPSDVAFPARMEVYALMGDMDGFYRAVQMAADHYKDDPDGLNMVAWRIVDPDRKLAKRDYDIALKLARNSVQLSKHQDPQPLDTLAWAYFGKGDNAKAIAFEKEALAIAPPNQKPQYEATLKKFQGA